MSNYRELCERLAELSGITINGPAPHDIQVKNDDFYERAITQGSVGLGESYMEGWWECEQMDEFFYRVLSAELPSKISLSGAEKLRILRHRFLNMQSIRRAFEVAPHYNMSAEFFENLLDARMNYSCGYWRDADNLDEAQEHKLDLVCRKIGLSAGDRVLDIGCGWGAFVRYATEHYDCEAVGITVAENQVRYIRETCAHLPVEVMVKDYRSLDRDTFGRFDKIVSIGMFEHVGQKNFRTYMQTAASLLADDGLFLLHTIADNISRVQGEPWMSKYMFHNSTVPSVQQIGRAFENVFIMEDWHNFGPDYYLTCMGWYANLERCRSLEIDTNMSREMFFRMWEYWLTSFGASFKARRLQLWQIVFSKGKLAEPYRSIR